MDEETGGIIIAEEGGGTKNEEGFTRLVIWLVLLLLLDSGVSRRGIKGVDDDKGGEGICNVGTVGEATLTGREGGGTVAEDWYGCPVIAAFETFPIVIAACNKEINTQFCSNRKKIQIAFLPRAVKQTLIGKSIKIIKPAYRPYISR
jgi:hypothetical protein